MIDWKAQLLLECWETSVAYPYSLGDAINWKQDSHIGLTLRTTYALSYSLGDAIDWKLRISYRVPDLPLVSPTC